MKKLLIGFVCLMVLLSAGCNTQQELAQTDEAAAVPTETVQQPSVSDETTTEAVTGPVVAVPQTISGKVVAVQAEILLTMVNREDTIELVGEFNEEYFKVKTDNGYGIIEKRLVRQESAEAYQQWGGYARSGASLYKHYHQFQADKSTLTLNTTVQVIDDLTDSYVVQVGDQIGYMRHDDVSRSRIQVYTGGSADGGDISLGFHGGAAYLASVVPQSGENSNKAVVLVDEAEILIAYADRDETLQLVNEAGFAPDKEGYYTVYLEGMYGYVRQNLVSLDEKAYEQWNGYARAQAAVYSNYYLTGAADKTLTVNTVVQILWDLDSCYLVSIDDQLYYMDKGQISQTKIVYSGGGGGGDWTDPVM